MKTNYQEIFKRAFAEDLRAQVSAGNSLVEYRSRSFKLPAGTVLQSMLEITAPPPVLNPDPSSDCENAIKIYEYLGNLDKTQASDKRLWIYLSHVTFRDYTIDRWPLRASIEDLTRDSAVRAKAINLILHRWFLSGNARSLRRHSIARLWWAAYLTVAPWDKDPEFFSSIDTTDKYLYTKILFSTQDILQQILERKLGWSDKVLIAILEYLRQNPDIAQNRTAVRTLMKELILVLGYRKLSLLSFEELLAVISESAPD